MNKRNFVYEVVRGLSIPALAAILGVIAIYSPEGRQAIIGACEKAFSEEIKHAKQAED